MPELSVRIEEGVQEDAGGPHLTVDFEMLQVHHRGHSGLPDPQGDGLELDVAPTGVDDDVAEPVGEGDEVPFRIDDDLLNLAGALLEDAPDQVRLAGAGVALDEKARREQLLDVHDRRLSARPLEDDVAQLDLDLHAAFR